MEMVNILRLAASAIIDPQSVPSYKWLVADGKASMDAAEQALAKVISQIPDEKLLNALDEAASAYRGAIEAWAFEEGMKAGAKLMLTLLGVPGRQSRHERGSVVKAENARSDFTHLEDALSSMDISLERARSVLFDVADDYFSIASDTPDAERRFMILSGHKQYGIKADIAHEYLFQVHELLKSTLQKVRQERAAAKGERNPARKVAMPVTSLEGMRIAGQG